MKNILKSRMMNSKEIKEQLLSLGSPEKAVLQQRFFKCGEGEYAEGDRFIGITVPELREVAKMLADVEIAEIWCLLQDEFHECRMLSLFVLVERYKRGDEATKGAIYSGCLALTAHINNWDLIDVNCPKIIGQHLLTRSRQPLYTLAQSSDLWEQRIAIVSTLQLIRNNDFADTIAISELLLNHPHDLIQKAVGWMLREVGKREITLLYDFLDLHHTTMPRTMLRYAIEKLSPDERAHYMGR
ncbi:MAG: DNA alkylation repair protein [Rikenellaceae bacterium]